MVDESLKRLLDAEANAELVIARADAQRQDIIAQARNEVRDAERQHAERVAGIHASFLAQAEQRAQQTTVELKRRHTERSAKLQSAAEKHQQQVLDAAVTLLLGDEKVRP